MLQSNLQTNYNIKVITIQSLKIGKTEDEKNDRKRIVNFWGLGSSG